MATALDLITGALLNINSYSPGEPVNASDSQTCLSALNDLLDSLSTDQAFVYTQTETIFPWIAGQYQYTVGNPTGGTFTGFLTAGSNAITSVTSLPSNIIATAGTQTGSTLTDFAGVIPTGTNLAPTSVTVNQVGIPVTFTTTVLIGATTALLQTINGVAMSWPYVSGVNTVVFSDGETRPANFTNGSASVSWSVANTGNSTSAATLPNLILMSANATATPAPLPDVITYTVPGNIPMGRPIRFRDGFTRSTTSGISNLDYAFQMVSFDRYKEELLKNIQGPWPYIATYQPTFPYGQLYVYPAPGNNYTAHLFADLILSDFASTTTFYSLPQGYSRALKKLLALELSPIYGKTPSPQLLMQAKEAKELLKSANDSPVVTLRFDSAISRAQTQDAGWIIHGGFA